MTNLSNRFDPVPVQLPDGREWPSIAACARGMGLHYCTVQRALERGTLGNLGTGRGASRKALLAGGERFPSVIAAALRFGVSPNSLRRLRARAVRNRETSFTFQGVTFQIPEANRKP